MVAAATEGVDELGSEGNKENATGEGKEERGEREGSEQCEWRAKSASSALGGSGVAEA